MVTAVRDCFGFGGGAMLEYLRYRKIKKLGTQLERFEGKHKLIIHRSFSSKRSAEKSMKYSLSFFLLETF